MAISKQYAKLDLDQGSEGHRSYPFGMGGHIMFTCPQTGLKVQHWLEDSPEPDTHSPVVCLACTKTHFIHNSTGKLLGEK